MPNVSESIEKPALAALSVTGGIIASTGVIGAITCAGGAVLDAVTSDKTLHLLHGLSDIASAIPLVGIVGIAMKAFFDMAKLAKFNKLASDALSTRIHEVGMALVELLHTVKAPTPALDQQLDTLRALIDRATDFLKKFSDRSYLSRLFQGSSDDLAIKEMDKKLTDSIASIQLTLGGLIQISCAYDYCINTLCVSIIFALLCVFVFS